MSILNLYHQQIPNLEHSGIAIPFKPAYSAPKNKLIASIENNQNLIIISIVKLHALSLPTLRTNIGLLLGVLPMVKGQC